MTLELGIVQMNEYSTIWDNIVVLLTTGMESKLDDSFHCSRAIITDL